MAYLDTVSYHLVVIDAGGDVIDNRTLVLDGTPENVGNTIYYLAWSSNDEFIILGTASCRIFILGLTQTPYKASSIAVPCSL